MILFAFKKVFENTTDALLGAAYTNKFHWEGIQQAISDRVYFLIEDKIKEEPGFMLEDMNDAENIHYSILNSDEYCNFLIELKGKFDQIPEEEISNYVRQKYEYMESTKFDGQAFKFNLDAEVDEQERESLTFDQFWQMIQDRNNA